MLIVEALAAGEMLQAASIMRDHLRHGAVMLHSAPRPDLLIALRQALTPGAATHSMSLTLQE